MQPFSLILISISSLAIFSQDIKTRYVHLLWMVLLGLGLILYTISNHENLYIDNVIINMGFLIVLWVILTVYFCIRRGKATNIINTYIGLGDVMIFSIFALGYNLPNLLTVILLGCICSITFWLGNRVFYKKNVIRIPLAGILSIVQLIIIAACSLCCFNPQVDNFLLLL